MKAELRETKLAIIHPFQFRLARGIERFTWSLAGALAESGVRVDLLTWRAARPVAWGRPPRRVRIRVVPAARYFIERLAIPYYLLWLLRGGYDWVLVFFADYGEAPSVNVLRRWRQQRYCIVFHFPREQVPHRYASFARTGLARRADHLVAVSLHVAEGVESAFGRPCVVIGNGVDASAFQPDGAARRAIRARHAARPGVPVLLSLAALEERKGIQWVVRALPRLLAEFPELQYWVLGEGDYRAALAGEITALGLDAHVALLGSRHEVAAYLAAADIGCLLSSGEAFPIAVLEYMATELPVMVSTHPPFPELVQPAWGLRVDETDPAAVAAALRSLLRDPARRSALGRAGRAQVLAHHTWEQVAGAYLQLLAGGHAMDRPSPRAPGNGGGGSCS